MSRRTLRISKQRSSICTILLSVLLIISLGLNLVSIHWHHKLSTTETESHLNFQQLRHRLYHHAHNNTASHQQQRLIQFSRHRHQHQNEQTSTQTHKIPRILIFTHFHDLLEKDPDTFTDEEERVLARNIRHAIQIHNTSAHTEVHFLTDDACVKSLQRTFPSLIPHFRKETEGMYKADICRGSALYETGGIYLDVDVGVRKDLWQDLLPTTEFVTALVHRASHYPGHFFQAIMGAKPSSPVVFKYLELFYDHYTGGDFRVEKGPLGVILLRRAYNEIYKKEKDQKKQPNSSKAGNDRGDETDGATNANGDSASGMEKRNGYDDDYEEEEREAPPVELYQEVLYDKRLFPNLHPAPTWGTRRACHFVVVAKVNDRSQVAGEVWHHKDQAFHIPLYSRIPGSRMCPTKDETGEQERATMEKNSSSAGILKG